MEKLDKRVDANVIQFFNKITSRMNEERSPFEPISKSERFDASINLPNGEIKNYKCAYEIRFLGRTGNERRVLCCKLSLGKNEILYLPVKVVKALHNNGEVKKLIKSNKPVNIEWPSQNNTNSQQNNIMILDHFNVN